MEHTEKAIEVYQLRILLRKISPQIWRRLLVRGDSTIAELHDILQITFGWTDDHLHQFLIHGKPYGIGRVGGISFDDNPHQVRLGDFHFRSKETWVYGYDLTDWWQHEIRLEQILPFDPAKHYPICLAGKRRGPIEGCGGPWAFMALQDEYPLWRHNQDTCENLSEAFQFTVFRSHFPALSGETEQSNESDLGSCMN